MPIGRLEMRQDILIFEETPKNRINSRDLPKYFIEVMIRATKIV